MPSACPLQDKAFPCHGLKCVRDNPPMNKALDSVEPPAAVDLGLPWSNPFADLGSDFSTRLQPSPLSAPYWVGTSASTAELLGLAPH